MMCTQMFTALRYALRRDAACGHAKFWMSRDRYRELIIVGDLNIMHETSAKILQNLEGEDVRMCHFSQTDVTVV